MTDGKVKRGSSNAQATAFIGVSNTGKVSKARQDRVNDLGLASLNNSKSFRGIEVSSIWPWVDLEQGK